MPTTADNIQRLRLERGWNHGQLASKVGVDRSLVAHWEKGRRNPESHLPALAEALGVSVAYLQGQKSAVAPIEPNDEGDADAVGLSEFIRWIRKIYKLRFSPNTVYSWVYASNDPLPFYFNHLKHSPKGEPTLLFDLKLARAWLVKHFRPGNEETPSFQ